MFNCLSLTLIEAVFCCIIHYVTVTIYADARKIDKIMLKYHARH